MKSFVLHLRRLDWTAIGASLALALIGLLSIYSSSVGKGDFLNFKKQLVFFVTGFLLMIIVSSFNWRALREDSYLIVFLYAFCLILLGGLFIFAKAIRGVKSWYDLGFFNFDPTEFTKIVLIIILAKYFSVRHIEMYRIRHILLSGMYVLLPSLLIFFQPDLGSVLILIALWMGILVISGIPLRHFLILIFCFVLIFIFSWGLVFKDYQKQRILNVFHPIEPLGVSWSQNQSEIAIGSGGVFGQGIGKGSQTQYGFLPEPQTDFIFASIAEETGLIGVSVLFILFSILIWRIMKIAISAESNFPRLFATGLAILLVSQIFINVGMNIGILPVIGIPLPLISYGGSSLISVFLSLGLLQSLKTH